MELVTTLSYILFCMCVIYPSTELVTAGFTIAQLFEGYLGSENVNFVGYHMKRISITALIHSALPLGYILCLWCDGETGPWMLAGAAGSAMVMLLTCYKVVCWWEDKRQHPAVRALLPYVTSGSHWRHVATNLNVEFRSMDKVSVPLSATSKIVATETWLIKVTQYGLNVVKQSDCALEATASDSHTITFGEDEVQHLNMEVIPSRDDVQRFSFRFSTVALRDLLPRLANPVRVPEDISLTPTLIEQFTNVFKQHVDQNPVYYYKDEEEVCIGCMQAPADVKLDKRCFSPPAHLQLMGVQEQCQQCNCRVLWCCECMARWWAARASGPPDKWLSERCSCPVCRATVCLVDVRPARPDAL